MITSWSGLNYNKCKRAELDVFYNRRLHKDVPKGVNKYGLIRMLRYEDEKPSKFKFLDLPAEMRNHVYRELLINAQPGSRRGIHPALLQPCHQAWHCGSLTNKFTRND